MKIKQILIIVLLALFSPTIQAQLTIASGETVTFSGAENLYTAEALSNAGTLTMGTGTLEAAGNYTNTASVNLSSATLKISGSGAQSFVFNTADVAKRVELNNTATATASTGKLDVTDFFKSQQGTLNANGNITLKSTSTKTAVVEQSVAGTITNMVVERYIPARRAYRFLASPVTTTGTIYANWQEGGSATASLGTHITGTGGATNGFDATTTNNPSLFSFDNSTAAWAAVANTNVGTLTAGTPYRIMVRGDRTVDLNDNAATPSITTMRATGSLVIGTSNVTGLNANADGYSLIGNPYQSPVNMATVTTNATNLNTTFYYVWDPTRATRGAYVTCTLADGLNNVSGSAVNQYLQPGQACFVQTLAAGAASLNFEESYKSTTTNEAVFRTANTSKTNTASSKIRLTLYDTNALATQQPALDGVLVLSGASYSNSVDSNDAGKFTNPDETMATVNNGTALSVESRAEAITTDEIPLKITQYRGTSYTIVADGTNATGIPAYLNDQFTQTYTEIPQSGAVNYVYAVDPANTATTAADRFKITYTSKTLGINNASKIDFSIYPNPSKGGTFNLTMPNATNDTKLTIYNTIGQEVYTTNLIPSSNTKITPNKTLGTGIYFVKITQDNEEIVKKLIIK